MRPQWITVLWVVVAAMAGSGSAWASGANETWEELVGRLFPPDEPQIERAEVAERIESEEDFYLLDIRSREEFAVSHIRGARFVSYDEFSLDDVADIPQDADIILYCAVGYRSGRVGRELRSAGYSNVRNMVGGILGWADDGRRLFDEDGVTHRVHGSGPQWGRHVENPDIEVVYENEP